MKMESLKKRSRPDHSGRLRVGGDTGSTRRHGEECALNINHVQSKYNSLFSRHSGALYLPTGTGFSMQTLRQPVVGYQQ
jgi:hypothetical protein